MKKRTLLFPLPIFVILSAGCSPHETPPMKYEIVSTDQGVYRLDKQSGEMVRISGSSIQVYNSENIRTSQPEAKPTSTPLLKEEDQSFPGAGSAMTISLWKKWRAGKLYFRMETGPYDSDLATHFKSGLNKLTVSFVDKDFFSVVSREINLGELSPRVDRSMSMEPLLWMFEGELPCSREDFDSIRATSVGWRFSDSMNNEVASLVARKKPVNKSAN